MISIESLSFAYPQDGFSLKIREFSIPLGQKLAVIGPSGLGKTTLLNLICGIYTPDSGSIQVADTSVHELDDAGCRDFRITNIGFVFQDFELLDYLTVLDNILHPYRITGALQLTSAVLRRARELARQMSIGSLVFDPCANGPRQGDFLEVMQQNVQNLSKACPSAKQGY